MGWHFYDNVMTVILGVAFCLVVICVVGLAVLYAVDRVRNWWHGIGGGHEHSVRRVVRKPVQGQEAASQFQMGQTKRTSHAG